MENIFTFEIEKRDYSDGSYFDKIFTNDYGKWHFNVGRDKKFFKIFLAFTSAHHVTEVQLKDLKITWKFFRQLNFVKLNRRGSTTCFECTHQSATLEHGYNNLGIKIKVDASSLPVSSLVLSKYVKKAFYEENQADVKILTADDKEIKASKFILSRSPAFNAMFNSHDTKESQEGVIRILDFNYDVIFEMVRYMYTDEVPKLNDMAMELLCVGNKYDLPGLVDITQRHLKNNITMENFADIMYTADVLNLDELKDTVVNFFVDNHGTILDSCAWMSFKQNYHHLAMHLIEKCFTVLAQMKSKWKVPEDLDW